MLTSNWERMNGSPIMPRINERKRSGQNTLKLTKRYDPIMRFPLKSRTRPMTLDYLEMIIALGCPSNNERNSGAKISNFCKRAELYIAMRRKYRNFTIMKS